MKQVHITEILTPEKIEKLSSLFLVLSDEQQNLVVQCIYDSFIKGRESIGVEYLTNNN